MFTKDHNLNSPSVSENHPFAQKRDYGFHAGRDLYSIYAKKEIVYNQINGVVNSVGFHRDRGNYVLMRHNLNYINIKDTLFSCYNHLSRININIHMNAFIENGQAIGNYGNTGYCMTLDKEGKYRFLTNKEIERFEETKGVHLHEEFFQTFNPESYSLLYVELEKHYARSLNENIDYIIQWGKIYYNPYLIYDFLSK
jgi:murein DD-endopeptidase MepM/ murein hydrolase activator NlpD